MTPVKGHFRQERYQQAAMKVVVRRIYSRCATVPENRVAETFQLRDVRRGLHPYGCRRYADEQKPAPELVRPARCGCWKRSASK